MGESSVSVVCVFGVSGGDNGSVGVAGDTGGEPDVDDAEGVSGAAAEALRAGVKSISVGSAPVCFAVDVSNESVIFGVSGGLNKSETSYAQSPKHVRDRILVGLGIFVLLFDPQCLHANTLLLLCFVTSSGTLALFFSLSFFLQAVLVRGNRARRRFLLPAAIAASLRLVV